MPNMLPEGHMLIPNKAATIAISKDDEPRIWFATCATAPVKNLYSTGVLGQYILFGDDLTVTTGKPLVAGFGAASDVVVLASALSAGSTFIWGLTVAKLIEFGTSAPPKRDTTITEEGLMSMWKVPNKSMTSLDYLNNTETHRLVDYADLLISYMPTFKKIKVKNIKQLEAYAKGGFTKVTLQDRARARA